jgi:hypothetical protein
MEAHTDFHLSVVLEQVRNSTVNLVTLYTCMTNVVFANGSQNHVSYFDDMGNLLTNY